MPVFKIECDPEWEKDLRPLQFKCSFKQNQCMYCSKLLLTKRKRKRHFLYCKIRDLYNDPHREKITTVRPRKGIKECQHCLQRFKSYKFKHKCFPNYYNKTLCLFCDKYFCSIRTHNCKVTELYKQHKDAIFTLRERKCRIFRGRLNKLCNYIDKSIKDKHTCKLIKPFPNTIKFFRVYNQIKHELLWEEKEKFKNEYLEIIEQKRQFYPAPWRIYPKPCSKQPQITFIDTFPTKSLENWTKEELDYWNSKVDVDLLCKLQKPTKMEKEATKGLITLEKFIEQQIYQDWEYTKNLRPLKQVYDEQMSSAFKLEEQVIFNKVGEKYGMWKDSKGKVKWIDMDIKMDNADDIFVPITPTSDDFVLEDDVLVRATPRRDDLVEILSIASTTKSHICNK
jgi:hypothetical protein